MPNATSAKLLLLPFAAALIALAAVLLSVQSGGAQTPPVPTPFTPLPTVVINTAPNLVPPAQQQIGGNVSICGVANPGALGGQTITDASGSLSITLVDGGNYSYGPPGANVGQPAVAICHQQTNSTLVISTVTGKEIRRVVRTALARSIFDHILANTVVIGGGAAPSSVGASASTGGSSASISGTTSTAAPSLGVGVVRPPSTGSAGLAGE